MKPTHPSLFINITASFLILLFTYTAVNKLIDPYPFEYALSKSPLLQPLKGLLIWLIPTIEIIVSITLLIPKSQLTGLYFSAVMMAAFTLYVGYMLLFIPDLPCACGGIMQKMGWKTHLVFNAFVTISAVIAIRLHKKYYVIRGSRKPVEQSKQSLIF